MFPSFTIYNPIWVLELIINHHCQHFAQESSAEVVGDKADFCLLLKSKVVRVERNTASAATEYDQGTQQILPRPPR